MRLFDVLRASNGLPAEDPAAALWGRSRRSPKEPAEHYGLKIAKAVSDPAQRCTYLYDAVGLTPKSLSNGAGGWADAFFVKHNYPAMYLFSGEEAYRLDPADHTKKADGTASDVTDENFGGNAMAVFDCHIWMKFYEDADYTYIEVANRKLDPDFVDWPYIRPDGSHAEKLFYPMYAGWKDAQSRLRSLSGMRPTMQTTAAQELQYAQANGSRWTINDWPHYLWMTCLLTLMGKSTDVQAAFGNGNMTRISGTATDMKINGLCNTAGQFYGTSGGNDPMKAFFIENIYSNRWSRTLGFYRSYGKYYLKTSPPYTVDGTFADYTDCGAGVAEEGFLQNLRITPCGPVPAETCDRAEETSGWYTDYCWTSKDYTGLLQTGGFPSTKGRRAGPWAMATDGRSPDFQSWCLGASVYLIG